MGMRTTSRATAGACLSGSPWTAKAGFMWPTPRTSGAWPMTPRESCLGVRRAGDFQEAGGHRGLDLGDCVFLSDRIRTK